MRGMPYKQKLTRKAAFGVGLFCLFLPAAALAGAYLLSAHGSSTVGVARSVMTSAGYGQGNCGHCHEMHASLAGDEPAPAGGAASPYALFAESLDPATTPYLEASNFCFYCHNSTGSAQQVTNPDYSERFGGGDIGVGPQSIMAAFNQLSYHNLGDIKTFFGENSSAYPWFSDDSNPCDGCHNPHLAKQNWVSIPANSAISKPSDHFNLWGVSQLMSAYSYEAPYAIWQSTYAAVNREPNKGTTTDGSKTPDYVGFCTDCHTSTNTNIGSTKLGRKLRVINWVSEKHGGFPRDVGIDIRQPYAALTSGNFVLSCLDCHEPHGSPNIMLLRRRINGEDLVEGNVTTTDAMGYVCRRCHTDDLTADAGTKLLNKWKYVHHIAPDHPYNAQPVCTVCHTLGQGFPIPCGNCHGHGMTDSGGLSQVTNRKTF